MHTSYMLRIDLLLQLRPRTFETLAVQDASAHSNMWFPRPASLLETVEFAQVKGLFRVHPLGRDCAASVVGLSSSSVRVMERVGS